MKGTNAKTILVLIGVVITIFTLYQQKDALLQLWQLKQASDASSSNKSSKQEPIFKHSDGVFYFDTQGTIWSVDKNSNNEEGMNVSIYNPKTKELLKRIPLPFLKSFIGIESAKWGDNLWIVDSPNEELAIINSQDYSITRDPKQVNALFPVLPEAVFSVDGADEHSLVLTFESGNQVYFNPELKVFSKSHNQYKRAVSDASPQDFYFKTKEQSQSHAIIVRYQNGKMVSEGKESFINCSRVYDDGQFVVLQHRQTLSKKSEKLISLIDKNCQTLWTINAPRDIKNDSYEVLYLSEKELILTNGFRSSKNVISIDAATGLINWKM
ncbi:hypothetical protein [Reichenbachiella versicolor]|uniref:hypothetical protein n=1 Tax=Reichenbachiella versicolor TaxID=1821036 RepID=UPI000D6E6DD9|nr:hypothetical protein [Reichenbachiella versicolor]